jgi:hypothetical protein
MRPCQSFLQKTWKCSKSETFWAQRNKKFRLKQATCASLRKLKSPFNEQKLAKRLRPEFESRSAHAKHATADSKAFFGFCYRSAHSIFFPRSWACRQTKSIELFEADSLDCFKIWRAGKQKSWIFGPSRNDIILMWACRRQKSWIFEPARKIV